MPARSAPTAGAALHLLEEQSVLLLEDSKTYEETPDLFEGEDKEESESPRLGQFLQEDGDRALLSMSNLTEREFISV